MSNTAFHVDRDATIIAALTGQGRATLVVNEINRDGLHQRVEHLSVGLHAISVGDFRDGSRIEFQLIDGPYPDDEVIPHCQALAYLALPGADVLLLGGDTYTWRPA